MVAGHEHNLVGRDALEPLAERPDEERVLGAQIRP
jgi:hypothetical protein